MAGRTRSGQGQASGQGQSSGPEEELPPPPTMAEVLLQIERNRAEDRSMLLDVIARNTAALTGASGSESGGGRQPRGGDRKSVV